MIASLAGLPFRRRWLQVGPKYRTALQKPVYNKLCRLFFAQDELHNIGATELFLSNAQIDISSPLCREWSLWAVRNLCEGNDRVQESIKGLQVTDVIQSSDLDQMGLEVEINKQTGKLSLQKKQG